MNSPLIAALLAAAALTALPSRSSADLFTNSGFESSSFPGTNSNTAQAIGSTSTAITGWTTSPAILNVANIIGLNLTSNVYYVGNTQTAHPGSPAADQGTFSVHLDSVGSFLGILPANVYNMGASISQTVNLAANTTYQLTFSYRAEIPQAGIPLVVSATGTGSGTVGVVVNYGTGFATQDSQLIAAQMYNFVQNQGWTQATMEFTTTSAGTVTVSFIDGVASIASLSLAGINLLGGFNNNVSLDGMSLTATPEVSHWALMGAFGGFVFWRWRKLRQLEPELAPIPISPE
ncbi:MAG: hypothetical protein JSR82_05415 [Verrucomicrobia bacterium]|nr:hypothetical protein [Verrucomicrobiota bacterium]